MMRGNKPVRLTFDSWCSLSVPQCNVLLPTEKTETLYACIFKINVCILQQDLERVANFHLNTICTLMCNG